MSTSMMKTLGALVLVGTLGVASCQAYMASHDANGGRPSVSSEERK